MYKLRDMLNQITPDNQHALIDDHPNETEVMFEATVDVCQADPDMMEVRVYRPGQTNWIIASGGFTEKEAIARAGENLRELLELPYGKPIPWTIRRLYLVPKK